MGKRCWKRVKLVTGVMWAGLVLDFEKVLDELVMWVCLENIG